MPQDSGLNQDVNMPLSVDYVLKELGLNYRIQGYLFPYHWITKAACYLSHSSKASD